MITLHITAADGIVIGFVGFAVLLFAILGLVALFSKDGKL